MRIYVEINVGRVYISKEVEHNCLKKKKKK